MKPAQTVYLVVGVPGSGKSWVCEQLTGEFAYIRHDDYLGRTNAGYLEAIEEAAQGEKPVLAEAPFSISQTKDPLEAMGLKVVPVFILQNEERLQAQYASRAKKDMPKGHLSRQHTYAARAKEYGAFSGTSDEVLEHLKALKGDPQ